MSGYSLRTCLVPGAAICIAAAMSIAGCQSSTAPTPQPQPPDAAVTRLPVAGQGTPDATLNTNQAFLTDASAVRLDEIVGDLLLYFRANQGMPGQLEDLRTVAGADLNLIAPCGQPYGYVPQGLSVRNSNKLLVVYDPQESADGRRWCILVVQLRPGAPLTAEVLAISETLFRTYLASQP
jgi:hypothetical protein